MHMLLLSRSLNYGGAERQLIVLATGLHTRGHEVAVAVFYPNCPLQKELEKAGVPVISLEKKGRWDVFAFLWRLQNVIRQQKPDIVHSYLAVPNILCLLLKPLFKKVKVVWGVRASNMDLQRYDWFIRLSYRIECRLARFADLIIANSHAGKAYAVKNGFPKQKIVVIPNGINTDYFKPNSNARTRIRTKWGIKENEKLIGLVGRFDPMKDHPTFLKAAASLAHERQDVRFVCVGDGPTQYREELLMLSKTLGLSERLIWAGTQSDMPAIYNALDISVSSSYGEGFPNVVGEAMACGVPCVVTDVGDSAWIVGETGIIVSPKNIKQLADSLLSMLTLEQKAIKTHKVRARVETVFSVNNVLNSTESVLDQLLDKSI